MMMRLADLVASHEDWLMHRVLTYAKENGYTRYTSTLAEAWRTSICGLSESLLECLKSQSSVPELSPDEDYTSDPTATFGIIEAKRHRKRGVSLGMFLGLMKYYRQSYIDLVLQAGFGIEEERLYRLFIDRFFDRIELGFCTEWNNLTENRMLEELQSANRCMTNEKNKYLTIFESISDPVFLFDKENRIENMNHAASEMFFGIGVPGSTYYDKQKARESFPWIVDELATLDASGQREVIFEKQIQTGKGILQLQVKIEQMLDVSEKFSGKVVTLNDITERKRAEETLRASHQIIEEIINAIPVGVFWKDKDLVYLGCNAIFARDAGFSDPKDIIGKDDYQMGWHDQAELYRADDRQVIESGHPKLLIEEPQTTPVGDTIVLLTSKIPLRSPKGEIIGVLGTYMDISERKLAEEALRDSESKLAAIIEFLPDATLVIDNKKTVIAWNRAMEEMTGVNKDDMIGQGNYAYTVPFYGERRRHLLDLIDVDDKDIVSKYQYVQRKGNTLYAETYTPALNGGKGAYVWATGAPLFDNQGNRIGAIESIRDITEHKRAERTLREQLSFLQQLIDSIPSPIFYKDARGVYLGCNIAFETLTGFAKDKIVGHTVYELYPKDLADIYYEADNKLFRNPGTQVYEAAVAHADGSRRDVMFRKATYFDTEDRLAGLVGVILDITERKHMENAIRESERRLADIINFLPDATLVIDKEGKVIAWNRAIETMTGIMAEEILGKGDYEYALPFYGERRPILIDLVLKSQEEIEKGYTHLRRQDGTIVGGAYMPTLKGGGIFLMGSAAALYDSEGNISGAIESIRDVTENKRAGEELCRAKNEAESAMRAKSEFLANMSHEIRTPMNAVIGMTGLLLNSDLNPDQRECVEIIHSSGEALLSIINDILDYSKIEASKGDLESQPFNLRECIESSMDLVASKAVEKNLNLTCKVDGNVPENLMGDITRLRQILVNLLSNAVKFTEVGKVSIIVNSQQKDDRHEICFTVRDTGIGIPPERMRRLFQSFSQVDMSTTRKYGGTGLGLAISKRLVEMMGGKIWAESEVGKGSAFHFTIVADSAPAGRIVRRPVSQPTAGQSASSPVSLHLLLAEDNVVNQKVALRMLGKLGYRADVAANGLEVLRALERQSYDIILMDVQMPEMDGLEAARAIRQLPQERQPKIIAITAYSLEGDREKCLEAGMDDYISKPVQMGELAEVLNKYQPSQGGS